MMEVMESVSKEKSAVLCVLNSESKIRDIYCPLADSIDSC